VIYLVTPHGSKTEPKNAEKENQCVILSHVHVLFPITMVVLTCYKKRERERERQRERVGERKELKIHTVQSSAT
jgi:hypothetical protein